MSWTFIKNEDIDNYIMQYPVLSEDWDKLALIKAKDVTFLPRQFYKNFPSHYLTSYQGKKELILDRVNINFLKTLRDKQQEAWCVVDKIYNNTKYCNGILKLFPGAGKTVLASYLTCKLGLKTCIVLDNENLMKQWIEEYLEFTDLTIDDIGIIQQKICVTNKPVTICMVQTLLSKIKNDFTKAFNEIDNAHFGLVIYDEVHNTSSSENFSKSTLLFRTPNIIGLSATPFHYGVSEILMKNTIGEILYETKDYELMPKYYFIYYNSGLEDKLKSLHRLRDYIKRKALYNSKIIESEIYLNLISKYTSNMLKNGYKTIIICITKKQVNMISDSLTKIGIDHRRFYGDEREIDLVNDSVVVATYSFCGKGFNMPSLSALILATPLSGKKSLIQVIGRILRERENKKDPIVIDLIDLAAPLFMLPEVKRKMEIIKNEFTNCEIKVHKEI